MPDGGSTALVPAAVGKARAFQMALLGERVSARAALEWGLANAVHPARQAHPRGRALCAPGSPRARPSPTRAPSRRSTSSSTRTRPAAEARGRGSSIARALSPTSWRARPRSWRSVRRRSPAPDSRPGEFSPSARRGRPRLLSQKHALTSHSPARSLPASDVDRRTRLQQLRPPDRRSATRAVVDAALDHGVTFFDTADIYGRVRARSCSARSSPAVATRSCWRPSSAWTWATAAARAARASTSARQSQASLRRLRTDVIDVYWYHQPDGETPIAETLETLARARQRGHGARDRRLQLQRGAARGGRSAVARERELTPFTAVQNEYSLLVREAEEDVLPACERLGSASCRTSRSPPVC